MLLALAALIPSTAFAQEDTDTTESTVSDADRSIAEHMLGDGGRITRDHSRRACLKTIRKGEIVVCAPDEEEFRIPSTADEDPTGKMGTDTGALGTPDVAGAGIFKGKSTATFGSVYVPLIIDLSTIPEAPAGSDADKIAKGELRAN